MSQPRVESGLIRLADQDQPVLHVIVQGRHHWTHGPKLYDHIQQRASEEHLGGILLDFLAYEYECGNDVGCLFLVGYGRKSGVHRPLAILATGKTRAALGTLAAAAHTDLRSFDVRFAESLEEGLGWLRSATPEPAKQRDVADDGPSRSRLPRPSQPISVFDGRRSLDLNPEGVLEGIGPVTTHWGMKMWRLFLGYDDVVACRYSFRESWRVGMAHETGVTSEPMIVPSDPQELRRLLRSSTARRYRVQQPGSITLRNRMVRNAIEVRHSGGTDSYGIYHRGHTEHYRSTLRAVYPTAYREAGFPRSLWGRILKW